MSFVQKIALLMTVRLASFMSALQLFLGIFTTYFLGSSIVMACILYNCIENHLYAS
jgi:hypothetical protein